MQVEESWIDRYYEALDFFFWEPQHLGRAKTADSKLDSLAKVRARLRSMEVTLNHLLKQFFSLAPRELRNKVFECALGWHVAGDLLMAGTDYDKEFNLQNSNQPDFLFTTAEETYSLEMKIKARSSVEQVLKYALLGLAVELKQRNHQMKHSLIFLASGSFTNLWNNDGSFASVEALRVGLAAEKGNFLVGQPKHFLEHGHRYSEIVDSLSIGFLNYGSFTELLQDELLHGQHRADSSIYQHLLNGMLNELARRQLTKPL